MPSTVRLIVDQIRLYEIIDGVPAPDLALIARYDRRPRFWVDMLRDENPPVCTADEYWMSMMVTPEEELLVMLPPWNMVGQ